MENWFKGLLLVIIFLAFLSMALNTHSNTLVTYPSIVTLNSNQSPNNYPVSPEMAISIANSHVPAFGEVRYGVFLVNNGTYPYYVVTMYENDPAINNYGKPLVVSMVDAKTGQYLGATA